MTELRTRLPKMVTTIPGPNAKALLKLREDNVPVGVSYGAPAFIEKVEKAQCLRM